MEPEKPVAHFPDRGLSQVPLTYCRIGSRGYQARLARQLDYLHFVRHAGNPVAQASERGAGSVSPTARRTRNHHRLERLAAC